VERPETTYHRFGQYSAQLESVRERLEREPVERRELDRICGELGIPGDFDVARISWQPDFDPFCYEQLRKRTRRMYLFRGEYIFELERAIVVEVPAVGHATYIFAPATSPASCASTRRSTRTTSGRTATAPPSASASLAV
jgi:hypothetical protein